MRHLFAKYAPALLVLAGVLLGILFTLQTLRAADARMREQRLTEVRLMERTFDWTAVQALRGEPGDAARAEYGRIKQQL